MQFLRNDKKKLGHRFKNDQHNNIHFNELTQAAVYIFATEDAVYCGIIYSAFGCRARLADACVIH